MPEIHILLFLCPPTEPERPETPACVALVIKDLVPRDIAHCTNGLERPQSRDWSRTAAALIIPIESQSGKGPISGMRHGTPIQVANRCPLFSLDKFPRTVVVALFQKASKDAL
jgi:hypothetical protein